MRCVACGSETGSSFRRWCDDACMYAEDGWPEDDLPPDDDEQEEDE